MKNSSYVYLQWFDQIGIEDIELVGGKNASLGEMYQHLNHEGITIPNGFAVTTLAYTEMLRENNLERYLKRELDAIDPNNQDDLFIRARRCEDAVRLAVISFAVREEILAGLGELQDEGGDSLTLAVRSSATAEDLPNASFAGQHESFLNIRPEDVIDSCSRCFASLFTPRAVRYRIINGIEHAQVALSIGLMRMVRSDLGASGVTFTLDTDSGHPGVVYTTATYGLGESLVQGNVDPDEFYVHKNRFIHGYRTVMNRHLGRKLRKTTLIPNGIVEQDTSQQERKRFCLSDEEVLGLTDIALKIERHYSEHAGMNQPMDIEWARDGIDGKLYVVQARPETVTGRNAPGVIEHYQFDQSSDSRAEPVLSGRAVGHQIASGKVRVIRSSEDILHFQSGEILVATTTSPDWGNVMQQASAIITDHGGRTCHAAIVAREMGIPAVVGTTNATRILDHHDVVTVACHSGQVGHVYPGDLAFNKLQTNIDVDHRPRTKIMLNIGNPDVALKSALLPNDGVGLARMEFIISNHVKVHPMAARFPQRIPPQEQHQLTSLAEGHTSAQEYFVTKLAEGIATIAGAFYPKPVIVRLSDFKSNEYAQLLGGKSFEPNESNPMIGFRGASRYSHPNYREGFALECEAIKRVRETMGFDNTQVMVPFCRRVVEGQQTIEEMRKHGLVRGTDLKIYLMCEIPNNVILIDDFAQDFDGFSIGSNDLTQLTLGVDRDSEIVAFDFDERDPGVLAMIRMAVEGAQRNGRTCGICGQAPSDYPEVAEYLVKLGIDSMSLNPDAVLSTTQRVIDVEKRLNRM